MLGGTIAAVTSGLGMLAAFLLVLMAVVFVHEFGHFIVARWCGVTVTTFSIGFGKELWSWVDRKGTRWRIAALPLGGYVKFLDDANAASAPDQEILKDLSKEELAGAFQTKPVWQRAAVVFAGPAANFIFAAVIYSLVNLTVGVRMIPPVIEAVTPGLPADKAGLKAGDFVTSVDGKATDGFDDVLRAVTMSAGRTLTLGVERDGKPLTLSVTPLVREYKDSLGVQIRIGEIGIKSNIPARIGEALAGFPAEKAGIKAGDIVKAIDGVPLESFDALAGIVNASPNKSLKMLLEREGAELTLDVTPVSKPRQEATGEVVCIGRIGIAPAPVEPRPVGPVEAVKLGVVETVDLLGQAFRGMRDVFFGQQPLEQVGGPILMAEVTAKAVGYGLEQVLLLMAFFSANIGLLNLLPIPLLDGGHLLFYAVEAVRRRPLTPVVQEVCFRIGLAIVLLIMMLAFKNDLVRVWGNAGGAAEQATELKKC